jgi:hypothetical protein
MPCAKSKKGKILFRVRFLASIVGQLIKYYHFPYPRYNQANLISDKPTSDICREQLKNPNFAIGHSPLYLESSTSREIECVKRVIYTFSNELKNKRVKIN